MSFFTAWDSIRRGTSSVPMLPKADVMKTLDMMMFFVSKTYVYFLMKQSESEFSERSLFLRPSME